MKIILSLNEEIGGDFGFGWELKTRRAVCGVILLATFSERRTHETCRFDCPGILRVWPGYMHETMQLNLLAWFQCPTAT
jgi:hypothetical protein